jgi:antitoxin component HigA of HigAB toxin-antitoxin module
LLICEFHAAILTNLHERHADKFLAFLLLACSIILLYFFEIYSDTLGTLILSYEDQHVPTPEVRSADVLRFLMEEHCLTAADLPEIGDESFLLDVLSGKQSLTIDNVKLLSQRFHIAAATFV